MNTLLTSIIIGISLSMDTFSLSLIYGTMNINNKNKILLSIIVGIYHFIMPLLGLFLGNIINNYIIINLNILIGVIFILISIQMITSIYKKEEQLPPISLLGYLIFGLSVSIDSFSTGIGLNVINPNYIECSTIFMLISSTFTYLGLHLGTTLNQKFGKYSTALGGIILLVLGVIYLLK